MNEVTIIFWKNTPSTNKITLSHRITGTKGYIYTIRNGFSVQGPPTYRA